MSDLYGAFVRDLHGRLVTQNSSARFTAGYSQTQFQVVTVCAILLGAILIGGPVVVLFLRPAVELIVLLGIGIAFAVPLFTMLLKNSPRSYEPSRIPTELLP